MKKNISLGHHTTRVKERRRRRREMLWRSGTPCCRRRLRFFVRVVIPLLSHALRCGEAKSEIPGGPYKKNSSISSSNSNTRSR